MLDNLYPYKYNYLPSMLFKMFINIFMCGKYSHQIIKNNAQG